MGKSRQGEMWLLQDGNVPGGPLGSSVHTGAQVAGKVFSVEQRASASSGSGN